MVPVMALGFLCWLCACVCACEFDVFSFVSKEIKVEKSVKLEATFVKVLCTYK